MKKAICVLSLCVLALKGCTLFHEHTWTAATCTEPAVCSECGETEGEALGHKWAEATCETPKTCSVCGETEGEALGHKWAEATCEAPKTCSVCGKTEGDKAPHTWVTTLEEPKTCSVCGKTICEALGHNWEDATCIKPMTCSFCGDTMGNPAGHTWVEATLEKPRTCSVCGMTDGDRLHSSEEFFSDAEGDYEFTLLPSNSIGGMQFCWFHKYTGKKLVTYATAHCSLFQGWGEPAIDENTNESTVEICFAVDMAPWEPGGYAFDIVKDYPSVHCDTVWELRIDSIELCFEDGERATVLYDRSAFLMEDLDWDSYLIWSSERYPEFWNYLSGYDARYYGSD